MNVRRYVKRMKRKILRISNNLFGLKTFPSLFEYMFEVKGKIEADIGKDVKDFTNDDAKLVALDYAIYKTCEKLCDIYLSLTEFAVFDMNDLTEANI